MSLYREVKSNRTLAPCDGSKLLPTTVCERDPLNQPANPLDKKKPLGVQNLMLHALRLQRVPVSVYLVNGIKLQGEVVAFDQYSVVLRSHISQMIFKHAISTIVASRPIEWRESKVVEKHEAKPELQSELRSQQPIAVTAPRN